MQFTIDGTNITIDLIIAQRQLERIESEVNLPTRTPTIALLEAIGRWLQSLGVTASRSACWALWWSVAEIAFRCQKQSEPMAEIAYWYGVSPYELTERQQLELLCNLPRVQAQATLHSGQFNQTDYNGVYDLVLLATGDQRLAQKAKADALERYVDSKIKKGF